MAESEDVNLLKRRGRRRLVGAIALVLAAVIVLPMVFDAEPRRSAPPVNLRIPGEDDSTFVPKVTAKKAGEKSKAAAEPAAKPAEKVAKAEEKPAEPPAPKPAAEPAPAEAPAKAAPKIEIVVKKAAEKPAPAPAPVPAAAERAKAESALAGGDLFVVQVGAFADADKIKEVTGKVASIKLPYFTEQVPVKGGMLTRVRVGPFPSRASADEAHKKLLDLGLKGSKVLGPS